MVTLRKITGMVIGQVTIPVMLYSNRQNYCTGNDIVTLHMITGTVIGKNTIPVMTL